MRFPLARAHRRPVRILVGVVALLLVTATLAFPPTPAAADELVPTTMSLTSSANPSLPGQRVTLIADVLAAGASPTGTVTFREGATVLGTAQRFFGRYSAFVKLPVGDHVITATFDGGVAFADSSTTFVQSVVAGPVTVVATSTASVALAGKPLLLLARVTPVAPGAGNPTGTVTFRAGSTVLGQAGLFFGRFGITTSSLPVGSHTITATYSGDGSFLAGSGSFPQVIAPGPTLFQVMPSANPTTTGAPVTLDAGVVTSTPGPVASGLVTVTEGDALVASASLGADGRAKFTLPSQTVGDHVLTVSYAGDASYPATDATLTLQVRTATSATARSTVAPVIGERVTLTAVVTPPAGSGAVDGTVTFRDGATVLGTAARTTGTADTFVVAVPAGLALGRHMVVATYNGSPLLGASAAAVPFAVTPAATITTLTVTPSEAPADTPIVLRATVAPVAPGGGMPGGSVTFVEGDTVLGTAPRWLDAYAIQLAHVPIGVHQIEARFSGSAAHLPSTSAVQPLTVNGVLWQTAPPSAWGPELTALLYPETIHPFVGAGPTIGMLGDSITYNLNYEGQWDARVPAAGFSTSITGLPGYHLATSKPYVDQYAVAAPDVMIVNLGTNDASAEVKGYANATVDMYAQRMALVEAMFPDSCFVVTTLTTHRTIDDMTSAGALIYTASDWNVAADRLNQHLRATYAHVADWDAVVAARPDLLPDEVHPRDNAEGINALIDLQLDAARACLATP